MNIQSNRLIILSLPLLLPLLLCVFLWQAVGVTEAQQTVYGFVALVGKNAEINGVAEPFLTNGQLRFVREYGVASVDYQMESPQYVPGSTFPPPFNIKVYQVQTETVYMNDVVDSVYAKAANAPNVHAEREIRHLAYLPKQLLVSGPCGPVSELVNGANLAPLDDNILPAVFDAQGVCFTVGLYASYNNTTVADTVEMVNQYAQNNGFFRVIAQPNQVTMGFPGAHFIFGGPAGMAVPGSVTPTLPTSPFAGSGQQIAVVVFDTAPYVDTPSVSTQTINGKDVTVDQTIALPSDLPFTNQAVISSHGTFVATPMTQLAPDSDLFIYRVLNRSAIGSEFMLIESVEAARDYFLVNAGNYNGVIFNYSLGLEEDVSDPSPALSRTLGFIHDSDIFQVAAAGNNSVWSAEPEAPTLPASHRDVLGVTAIVPGNNLACYANRGDIATWGGGNERVVGVDCLVDEVVNDCAAGSSPNCLTGFDPNSANSWAYGIGTSFASPIIAAMVAQQMETMPPSASSPWVSPRDARAEIEAVAVLDVPAMGKGYIGDFAVPTSVGLSSMQQTQAHAVGIMLMTILAGSGLTWLVYRGRIDHHAGASNPSQ